MNDRARWAIGWVRVAVAACVIAALPAGGDTAAGGAPEVDDALPSYAPAGQRYQGTLRMVGSPTAGTLLAAMHAGFRQFHPDASLDASLSGAAGGPPALLAGTAQMAAMGRPFTAAEAQAFRAKYGYPPTEVTIAVAGLAVFVNHRNPVEQFTVEELHDVFSQRRRADGTRVDRWSELRRNGVATTRPTMATTTEVGVGGDAITLYGSAADRAESVVFRERVLGSDDFSAALRVQRTQSSAAQGPAADPGGIAYGSLLYASRAVRVVPIVNPSDGVAYPPTAANCQGGRYPLARMLYVYVNKRPGKRLDPMLTAFLTFVVSRDGQRIVAGAGLFPLNPEGAEAALRRIGD